MAHRTTSSIAKRTISLPAEQSQCIDSLVASGGYASASEVVRASLRALQERDAAVDRWLRDEVVPVYDAMQVDPGRARSSDQVADRLQEHHAARLNRTVVTIEVVFAPEAENDLIALYDYIADATVQIAPLPTLSASVRTA